jgi:hypothetical protein
MADDSKAAPEPAPDDGVIPGADTAADSVEAMARALADQQIRAALSDYEKRLQDMMAAAQQAMDAQQAQFAAQAAQFQSQLAAVRKQAGPPEPLLLAESLEQRVKSIASANPDLGRLHFAGVIGQAERLHEAVSAVADGTGTVHEAELLVQAVTGWFTRTHPRASGKFLEGAHSAVDELERIADGIGELAPVVTAIASVV